MHGWMDGNAFVLPYPIKFMQTQQTQQYSSNTLQYTVVLVHSSDHRRSKTALKDNHLTKPSHPTSHHTYHTNVCHIWAVDRYDGITVTARDRITMPLYQARYRMTVDKA